MLSSIYGRITQKTVNAPGLSCEESISSPSKYANAVFSPMGRLPPRCREALLLRYGCGYSTRETASLLELSFAAAQKLLQRAKAALRQELEKEGLTV